MGRIIPTPRAPDSYEEKDSGELCAEKHGMCEAAARLGFSLHFPLDTQDKVSVLPQLRPAGASPDILLTSTHVLEPTR